MAKAHKRNQQEQSQQGQAESGASGRTAMEPSEAFGNGAAGMSQAPIEASEATMGNSPEPQSDQVQAFVKVDYSCALRRTPEKDPENPHANTLADLQAGTLIRVIDGKSPWTHVIADVNGVETEGFISSEFVLEQGEDGSIPMETIKRSISDGPYGWDASYDIWALEQTVFVRLRVKLTALAGVSERKLSELAQIWEGAEDKWSGQHDLVENSDPNNKYGVSVDFQFVETEQHHDVNVRPGPARSNLSLWDTADDVHAASHELGHAMGMVDEYADSASPSRSVTDESSVMHSNDGEIRVSHYQDFADWLGGKKGSLFNVQ